LRLDSVVIQQGRLVETQKALGKDEVLSMIRHGAREIFEAKGSLITDADIDTILEMSEARTEALNEKMNKLGEGKLRDFAMDAKTSIFNWEGEDYREKKLAIGAADTYIEPPTSRRRTRSTFNREALQKQTGLTYKPPKIVKPKPDDYVPEEDPDDSSSEDSDKEVRARKKARIEKPKASKDKLPPLLVNVDDRVKILGFDNKERKAFLDCVMRHGMPVPELYQSQWLVGDLKDKSEAELKAYSNLFMCHLSRESSNMNGQIVSQEGLTPQNILTRIGIMCLVKRKVQEFEKANGEFSMPKVNQSVKKLEVEGPVSDELMQVDSPANEPKQVVPPLKFDIADKESGDLHLIWSIEANKVKRNGSDFETWNRRHDFWLLNGVSVHGYGNYQSITSDPRFSIINEAFKHNPEAKYNFLENRFGILEQALIAEETSRRTISSK